MWKSTRKSIVNILPYMFIGCLVGQALSPYSLSSQLHGLIGSLLTILGISTGILLANVIFYFMRDR